MIVAPCLLLKIGMCKACGALGPYGKPASMAMYSETGVDVCMDANTQCGVV